MPEREGDFPGASSGLLVAGDPDPTAVENLSGSSPFLLLGDHAGRAIPARLQDLGVNATELQRHIAWDIGVAGLGAELSARLDAVFVHQRYSRLVIDCNRRPDDDSSMPEESDGTAVPGNLGLLESDRAARRAEIFTPYHDRIDAIIRSRERLRRPTILVSLHSFTPRLQDRARPWRFGVLHRGDSAISSAVLNSLQRRFQSDVGDNEPYAMDGLDYTIPHHADAHGLDYLELEVRQDALADQGGWRDIAAVVGEVLLELAG